MARVPTTRPVAQVRLLPHGHSAPRGAPRRPSSRCGFAARDLGALPCVSPSRDPSELSSFGMTELVFAPRVRPMYNRSGSIFVEHPHGEKEAAKSPCLA